jgi:hypothetical protein
MNSLVTDSCCQFLCSYTNTTSAVQIIQIVNISNWYFERVVFPWQRLFFEAKLDAELDVYTSRFGQAILVKQIPAIYLQVEQGSDSISGNSTQEMSN